MTNKLTTGRAIMLEDGFVYAELLNGDFTDGDNIFKAELFNFEEMTADIEQDSFFESEPWSFEILESNNERAIETINHLKELSKSWDFEKWEQIQTGATK